MPTSEYHCANCGHAEEVFQRITEAALVVCPSCKQASFARVVTGGTRPDHGGYFFRPTLLADVPRDARAMAVEPFGPIVLARPFNSEAEAVAIANDTRMGLSAYVYTDSASRQARLVASLRVGMVAINHPSVSSPEAPFGGVGDSGYGSECGVEGLDAYLQTKFVHQFPAFERP